MAAPVAPVPAAVPVHFVNVTPISGLPRPPLMAPPSRTRAANKPSGMRVDAATQGLAGFLGTGACIIDFDGDGRPDIFLVNADGKGNAGLYRNTGKGTFVNVTKAAKIELRGAGMGCAVGDYDNDGHPDLVISS